MTFGEKVTKYEQYSSDTYGYILKLTTAPTIKKMKSVQAKTATLTSSVITAKTDLATLLGYTSDSDCPELAYSLESGIAFIFFRTAEYPYADATRFLALAYRFPAEITSINDELDIMQGDKELFIAFALSTAAEVQGKLIPQKITDKISYYRQIIEAEND